MCKNPLFKDCGACFILLHFIYNWKLTHGAQCLRQSATSLREFVERLCQGTFHLSYGAALTAEAMDRGRATPSKRGVSQQCREEGDFGRSEETTVRTVLLGGKSRRASSLAVVA